MWFLFVLQYTIKCREILREKLLPITQFNYSSFCIAILRGSWTLLFPQEEEDERGASNSDFFLAISLLSSGMDADAKSPLSVFLEQ